MPDDRLCRDGQVTGLWGSATGTGTGGNGGNGGDGWTAVEDEGNGNQGSQVVNGTSVGGNGGDGG